MESQWSTINIAATTYEVRDYIPQIRFIHIGKCGGTTLLTAFKDQGVKLHNWHLRKPKVHESMPFLVEIG